MIGKIAPVYLLLCICMFIGETSVFAAERDVWLIDTQYAPLNRASEQGFQRLLYYRLENNRWKRSDAETFFETQAPEIPLVFFSPGYTSTLSDTSEIGLKLYRLCAKHEKPFRMVLWHWPSEQKFCCLLRDIRGKIPVAETSGKYLGMFMEKLDPESKVSLFGFSFGTRVVCDAISYLDEKKPESMKINAILAGAATDRNWLSSKSKHGNIPRLTEKLLVLYNPHDSYLKFYPALYSSYHPESLGRLGPPLQSIQSEFRDRIEAVNVFSSVGSKHKTVYHIQTYAFQSRIKMYLLFADEEQK